MRHPYLIAAFVFGLCMGGGRTLFGQTIHVDVDGTPCSTCSVVGTDVSINASTIGSPPGTFNRINVYVTPENSGPIGTLTLSGVRTGGSPTFDLIISNAVMPADPESPFPNRGATSWGGISAPIALRDQMRLGGRISGALSGSVSAKEVYRLEVGGDVRGSVTATGTGPAIRRLLVDGSIQATDPQNTPVVIEATTGDIEKVAAGLLNPSGGIFAPIKAETGRIEQVLAAGAIGPTAAVVARDAIYSVHASSIAGPITSGIHGGTGYLVNLETTTGGLSAPLVCEEFIGVAGPFPSDIVIRGDVSAEIFVKGTYSGNLMVQGSVVPPAQLRFGRMRAPTGNLSVLHVTGNATSIRVDTDVNAGAAGGVMIMGHD